jgi:hypothetical protein
MKPNRVAFNAYSLPGIIRLQHQFDERTVIHGELVSQTP